MLYKKKILNHQYRFLNDKKILYQTQNAKTDILFIVIHIMRTTINPFVTLYYK